MFKQPNWVYGPRNVLINPSLNFGEVILEKLRSHQGKECLINAETGERLTYDQMLQQAMNLSISLARIGVRKGEVIAICSENRNEYFVAVIGGICAGAVLTTINVGYTKGELSHVMNISKPKYIILSPDLYKKNQEALKTFPFVKKTIVFGDTRFPNTISYSDLIFIGKEIHGKGIHKKEVHGKEVHEKEIHGKEINVDGKRVSSLKEHVNYDDFQPVEVDGQSDVILLLYSSGTTGLPKGVMLTHHNLLVTAEQAVSTVPISHVLTIAPWYHVMGLVGTIISFIYGRTSVYLPKFNVDLFLQSIETYKIKQLTVVPPVLVAICKSDVRYDVSSVDVVYSGAAPLHKDTLDVLKHKFPQVKAILQGYGMTECTLAVCRGVYEEGMSYKLGSCGKVTAFTIIKRLSGESALTVRYNLTGVKPSIGAIPWININSLLVADLETDQSLGPNQRGEIRFKGPTLMKGYIGKDLKEDLDEEGFFKTGDIGYYDDDKEFHIVDRLKELIKYKGYQVPPAEIEAVLLQHPGIKDAGVIGIQDNVAGEVPMAFVVRQPAAQITAQEVKNFIAERLSNPKHLRGSVRFISEIPKNPSGKILRRMLKVIAEKSKL